MPEVQGVPVLVEELEHDDLVKIALPKLAKRFDITLGEIEGIVAAKNCFLSEIIGQYNDSEVRGSVNQWWRKYKGEFGQLGLARLTKVESPAKLPDATYCQLIVLMAITKELEQKKRQKELAWARQEYQAQLAEERRQQEEKRKVLASKLTGWQRFMGIFRRILAIFSRNDI